MIRLAYQRMPCSIGPDKTADAGIGGAGDADPILHRSKRGYGQMLRLLNAVPHGTRVAQRQHEIETFPAIRPHDKMSV